MALLTVAVHFLWCRLVCRIMKCSEHNVPSLRLQGEFQSFSAVFRAQPRGDVAPAVEFVSSDATAAAKLARWHLVPVGCQRRRAQMAR